METATKMTTDLLLFPGKEFRFLSGDELPVATGEHIQHRDNAKDFPKSWTPCGRDFSTLTAARLRKHGIFVRRKK